MNSGMSLWIPPEGLEASKSGSWEETASDVRLESSVGRGGGGSEGLPRSQLVWQLTFRADSV